jgi:uncharacterized protein YkwD
LSRSARGLVALLLAAIMTVCGQVALAPSPAGAKLWEVPEPDLSLDPLVKLVEHENRVVHLVNKKRKAHDLAPVKWFNSCLDRLSERWAAHIAETGELVHRNQRKVLRRCDLTWAGENLVRGSALTPAAAVKAWMESDGHRAVLLKSRARWAGMGVKIDDEGRYVGVLNLGDPN